MRIRAALRFLPITCTLASLLTATAVCAFEPVHYGALTAEPSVNLRLGLQYGTGINYGLGALDTGERSRSSLTSSIKPRLGLKWQLDGSELYSAVSVAAATTQLDGEISGAFARAGDYAVDTDEAHIGWRNAHFDISYGAQDFSVADGLLIADGNFDTGSGDGQYWVVPFSAWRNAAIVKFTFDGVRGDAFWLRSDRDFGDSRVVGLNLEHSLANGAGKIGAMYLQVIDSNRFNNNGVEVWDFRVNDLKVPQLPNFLFFAEVVREVGRDVDGRRDNDALGWYLEAQYNWPNVLWTPTFTYRYAHFSGDDPKTPANEGYRALFYTFYKREWDTWYMGEIAGEYHLFNTNQISQMVKLEIVPRESWIVTLYYYHHDLEQPQYFGTPVRDKAWADELNLGVEYFHGEKFYGYVGLVWSTPAAAAREIFGHDDDFTVLQTWLSYTF